MFTKLQHCISICMYIKMKGSIMPLVVAQSLSYTRKNPDAPTLSGDLTHESWLLNCQAFSLKKHLEFSFFPLLGIYHESLFSLSYVLFWYVLFMIEPNRYFVCIKYNGKLFWAASDVWINIDLFIFPKYIFWSNSTYFELKYSEYIITKLLICEVWKDFQL